MLVSPLFVPRPLRPRSDLSLINKSLAKLHSNKLPIAYRGLSWTATTFSSHFSQRLSNAVNMGVADQIAHVVAHWRRPPARAAAAPPAHAAARRATGAYRRARPARAA